jgi:hypothetical protein
MKNFLEYATGGSFKEHKMFIPPNFDDYVIAKSEDDHNYYQSEGYLHEDELPTANMGMSVPASLGLDMEQAIKNIGSMYNKKAKEKDKLQKGPAAAQNFSTDEFIAERKESFLEYVQRVNEQAMAKSALESWMSAKNDLNGLPSEVIMGMTNPNGLPQAYDGGNASSYFGMGPGAGFSSSMQPWISSYQDKLAQDQKVGMNLASSAQSLAEDIAQSIYAPKVADTKTKTKLLFKGDEIIHGEKVYDKDGIYKRTKRDRIKRDWFSPERRKDKAKYRAWKKENRPIFREQRRDARKQNRQDEILQYQQAYYPEFFEEQNQNVQDNISAIGEETKELFKSPWAMDDNYKFGLDENFEYKPYGADMFGYGSFSNSFRYGGAYYDQFGGNVNPFLKMYRKAGQTQADIKQAEVDAMRAQNTQALQNIRRGNYFQPVNTLGYSNPRFVHQQFMMPNQGQFVIPDQYGYAQDYRFPQPALFRGRHRNLRPRFGAMPMMYDPTKTFLRSEDIKVGPFRSRARRLYEQLGNAPWQQGQDVQKQDVQRQDIEDAQVIQDGTQTQGRPSFDEIAARETEGLSRRDQRKTMRNLRRARRNDVLDYFMTPEERGETPSARGMGSTDLSPRSVQPLDSGFDASQMQPMDTFIPTPGMDAVGPNAAPATTAEAEEEKPAFDYNAYDERIKTYVDEGKTLDDLVASGMGTKKGLEERFPDLFGSSSATKTKSTAKKTSAGTSAAPTTSASTPAAATPIDNSSYANSANVFMLDPSDPNYVPKNATELNKLLKTNPELYGKWTKKLGSSPRGMKYDDEYRNKQLQNIFLPRAETAYKKYLDDKDLNYDYYAWLEGDVTPDTQDPSSNWYSPKTMDDLWKLKDINPDKFRQIMDAIRQEGDTYGENDQENLDRYYKNAKDRAISYLSQNRQRAYGGSSSPVYAEDYDMAQNVYIPYMDDGGNTWAQTSVTTRERSANPVSWLTGTNKYGQMRADTILDWFTNIGENRTAKRSGSFSDISGGLTPDEAMREGMFTASDMMANVAEDRSDETYGNWMINRGDVFNPVTSAPASPFTGFDYGQIGGPAVAMYGGEFDAGGHVHPHTKERMYEFFTGETTPIEYTDPATGEVRVTYEPTEYLETGRGFGDLTSHEDYMMIPERKIRFENYLKSMGSTSQDYLKKFYDAGPDGKHYRRYDAKEHSTNFDPIRGFYKSGGPVQVNDVVELSESEIEALLKAGGQIEYL